MNHAEAEAADADEAYLDTYRPLLRQLKKAGLDASLIAVGHTERVLLAASGEHQVVVSDNGRPLPWDVANITQVVLADGHGQHTLLPGDATPEEVAQAVTELVNSPVG